MFLKGKCLISGALSQQTVHSLLNNNNNEQATTTDTHTHTHTHTYMHTNMHTHTHTHTHTHIHTFEQKIFFILAFSPQRMLQADNHKNKIRTAITQLIPIQNGKHNYFTTSAQMHYQFYTEVSCTPGTFMSIE